jgi:hypothetical protein
MKRTSFIFIGLYMVACIIYSGSIFSKLGGTKKTKRSADSLYWEWNYFKFNDLFYMLFLATLVVLFYFEFDGWIRNVSIFITIASFLFSMYKYQVNVSVGRFWCYIAAFSPLIYLIKLI